MYTYTTAHLKEKTFNELKTIARDMALVPQGDRRCRQNWVDVIVSTPLPLLKLLNLEVSPVVEVDQHQEPIEVQHQEPIEVQHQEPIEVQHQKLIEVQHQEPIEVDQVQEPIKVQAQEPPIESKFGRIIYAKPTVKPIAPATETSPSVAEGDRPLVLTKDAAETSPSVSEGDRVQEPIKNSPSVSFNVEEFQQTHAAEIENYFASFTEADKLPNQSDNGRDRLETEPKLSQSAIVPTVKNSPGVSRKSSTAHQLLDLFKSSAVILEDSPTAETEAETLESAIDLATKNLIDAEADQNPILTGITFSANFLDRYSPPQLENIHYQSDANGQLNLLDFEVESVDEPPDPDDFESLNAFREAIALWEAQHPEPLEISLDSFCEWAPCPDDWYEPAPSEVLELSPTIESSSTCKFLIPVFEAWCDRANRQNDTDEPPDRGIFARLPKPKPPSFPPMNVVVGDRANRQNDTDEPPDRGIFARLPKPKPPSFPPMNVVVGDRANRQNNTDEPPNTGIFARLPKPKPPSFPLMSVVVGDRANHIKKFGRNAKLLSGRSPPEVMN